MKNVQAAVRRHSERGFAMSNFVIKYGRDARVKYISHLDFVRMFHRSVRRSGLPFVFSQGFNPHPVMTVAVPLSVGVTADGEYMKVGFDTNAEENSVLNTLNSALPDGFFVSAVKRVEGKELDFNNIEYAEYIIDAEAENPEAFSAQTLLAQENITVMKKSKSGEKETDIKPLIYNIEAIPPTDGTLGLRIIIAAGNRATLKPETVIAAINKYQPETKVGFFAVHRRALLNSDGCELI